MVKEYVKVSACPKNKGFSLVELIIVIAIMAILAAAIAPALIRYIDKSRREDDVQMGRNIGEALSLAISSGEDYEYGGESQDLYSWYVGDYATAITLQDDDGNDYNFMPVATWTEGQSGNVFVTSAPEYDKLVEEINKTTNPVPNMLKCKKNPGGSALNSFYVGRNTVNGRIEVWIGTSADPLFMVYPEICDLYE